MKAAMHVCASMNARLTRQCLRKPSVFSARVRDTAPVTSYRSFTSSLSKQNDSATANTAPAAVEQPMDQRPRWSFTPERMKAPFSLQQPKDPRRSIWEVNNDPAKLDRMYEKLIGRDLARTLPDELKWLAVTHKSFDNGRRGFNTRLAYYGRMIIAMEATRAIMGSDVAEDSQAADPHGRQHFQHPALDNVDKLNSLQPHHIANPTRISQLAKEVGMQGVVRWKPKMPENLEGSGIDLVLTSSVFAVVGVISLHSGADVASRMVREKILKRLAA